MAFSPNKEINKNQVFAYRAGDILLCPICKIEHYRALRDIYQGDHMVPGQLETIDERVEPLNKELSEYCQFCFQGGRVMLVALYPAMVR